MVQLILCRLVPCFGLNRSCLDRVGKSDSLSHHHEGPQAMTISHFNAFWATLSAGSLLRNTSQLTHRYTPTKSKFAYSCHQHGTKTTSQRDIEASATAAVPCLQPCDLLWPLVPLAWEPWPLFCGDVAARGLAEQQTVATSSFQVNLFEAT